MNRAFLCILFLFSSLSLAQKLSISSEFRRTTDYYTDPASFDITVNMTIGHKKSNQPHVIDTFDLILYSDELDSILYCSEAFYIDTTTKTEQREVHLLLTNDELYMAPELQLRGSDGTISPVTMLYNPYPTFIELDPKPYLDTTLNIAVSDIPEYWGIDKTPGYLETVVKLPGRVAFKVCAIMNEQSSMENPLWECYFYDETEHSTWRIDTSGNWKSCNFSEIADTIALRDAPKGTFGSMWDYEKDQVAFNMYYPLFSYVEHYLTSARSYYFENSPYSIIYAENRETRLHTRIMLDTIYSYPIEANDHMGFPERTGISSFTIRVAVDSAGNGLFKTDMTPVVSPTIKRNNRITLKLNRSELSVTALENQVEFVLFDSCGRLIKSGELRNNQHIDLADLARGVYIYRIRNSEICETGQILLR